MPHSRNLTFDLVELHGLKWFNFSMRPTRSLNLGDGCRRADWIDVSRGLRRFGVPRPFIAAVATTWPNAGFHRRLVQLTIDRFWKHPLSPLPMVKW
jgi:hypothetical protein